MKLTYEPHIMTKYEKIAIKAIKFFNKSILRSSNVLGNSLVMGTEIVFLNTYVLYKVHINNDFKNYLQRYSSAAKYKYLKQVF